MAQPYVGEIRMFAGNFAPAGWQFCDGQTLPISEFETLFQLIGTTYGGDGQSTFALPDLRGRAPIHQGNGYVLAQTGGVEQVTLTINQIPAHGYTAADEWQDTNRPAALARGSALATPAGGNPDGAVVGGSQPHENRSPYLAVSFIISLFGIFPSPT